jgi:hypothetical protein
VPALNPAMDFDFAFPSLEGERSDRRDGPGLFQSTRQRCKPQKFPEIAYLCMSRSSKDDFMPGGLVPANGCSRQSPVRHRPAFDKRKRQWAQLDPKGTAREQL